MGVALCASAQDDGTPAETKGEAKARVAANIEKKDNGDVIIKPLPRADIKEVKGMNVDHTLLAYLYYANSSIDIQKLVQFIDRSTKGGASNLIVDYMEGAIKYMGTKNMNFQKLSPSLSNIAQRIDEGLPVYCWLFNSNEYGSSMTSRTKERDACADIREWAVLLRKKEVKNGSKNSKTCKPALVMGYNATTKELMVWGVAPDRIWMTEREFKDYILQNAYALRF